jgi:hypothetical protein
LDAARVVLFLSKPSRWKEHSMLDELLEVFERDRKKHPHAPKQKGIRGLLGRLRDTDDDDRRYASSDRREYRDDDDRRYRDSDDRRRYRDDDDDDDRYYDSRRGRRREREGFDFFDD